MKHIKIYLMLVGFSVFTGASFNLAKYTVGYFSPFAAAAWRFGLAAATLLIILIFTEGINKHQLKRNTFWYMVLGLVGIFGFSTLFFVGLKYTSSVNGALIMALNPLLTTILARVILKDRITKIQAAGIFLAFIGVLLVIMQGSIDTIKMLSFSIGDVIIFGGNVCWTFYGVFGRRFIQDGNPLSTTTYTMIIGAICLIVVSLFTTNPIPLPNIPIGAWGAILFMAFFTSVLGYMWWNKGMKEIGATKTSLFFNLVPVITMLISFATGIPVSIVQILDAVLVILGVLTASGVFHLSIRQRRRKEGTSNLS
ncbi:EamA family transporter [Paenibacillus sp. LMG 31456]|uniref:EamA family transporter n=1 Tax=Paenibacillus foliorum TaxID=2654974 RepID=A0A972K1W1_9BACL|nr:EamA family transporter [Paenibacillus foliorum]NOU93217.1 EamA family transporter [Paenibacillus foliorum]